MVKNRSYRSGYVAFLLVVGFALVGAGCFGGDGSAPTTESTLANSGATPVTTSTTLPGGSAMASNEALSTFRSKDPFIPQAVVTTEEPSGSTSTTEGGGPTTTFRPGGSTTTTGGGGGGTTSTASTSTTSTTAAHLHTLKVLAIGQVGGKPAVTFQVDGSVYKDKRIGDVVSTNWGQIKILDISTSSKVVTLLQGSETLVLTVGQTVFE
ncbi:MAG: hypothetical protein A2133_08785 [Actinobacteria bacterium RBG_16_64_13]|nr:MAG: hypothetical protein A2133_08785 [Actinobacteria bacterium RBG_16_64_13]